MTNNTANSYLFYRYVVVAVVGVGMLKIGSKYGWNGTKYTQEDVDVNVEHNLFSTHLLISTIFSTAYKHKC